MWHPRGQTPWAPSTSWSWSSFWSCVGTPRVSKQWWSPRTGWGLQSPPVLPSGCMRAETKCSRASIALHLLFPVLTDILAYLQHLTDDGGLWEEDRAPWPGGSAAPSLLGFPWAPHALCNTDPCSVCSQVVAEMLSTSALKVSCRWGLGLAPVMPVHLCTTLLRKASGGRRSCGTLQDEQRHYHILL